MTLSPFSNYLMTQQRNGLKLHLLEPQRVMALASTLEILKYLELDQAATDSVSAAVAVELSALPRGRPPGV